MDGDHPKTIVLHRDGNPPRAGGCLRDFYLKIKTTSNKIENNIKIMMTSKKSQNENDFKNNDKIKK